MIAIIAEDRSDVETLTNLVRRIANNDSLSVRGKGYEGCSQMLRKGAGQMRAFRDLNCSKFIVCYDSDNETPESRKQKLLDQVIIPSGVVGTWCALVPVQEIESWILADLTAVTKIISGWAPDNAVGNPEHIDSPKEYLEKMSRKNQRPRYTHAVHNPKIAKHLNVDTVHAACPSFRPLYNIIKHGQTNI